MQHEGRSVVLRQTVDDLASRKSSTIDEHVDWIFSTVLDGQPARVLDLGCGPGLYAQRLSSLGCEYVADLIGREQRDGALDTDRVAQYQHTLELVYDHFVTSVAGLYRTFASHELSLIRYRRDVHVYWNLYTRAYLSFWSASWASA